MKKQKTEENTQEKQEVKSMFIFFSLLLQKIQNKTGSKNDVREKNSKWEENPLSLTCRPN